MLKTKVIPTVPAVPTCQYCDKSRLSITHVNILIKHTCLHASSYL